jgi:IS30 family transposase
MVGIHVRPPEVDDRVMPCHWEGDFTKGAGDRSAVGVLVERTSRLVLLARMDDATAAAALVGFRAKLNSIAAPLRKSLTYDQGKEMAQHVELSAQTGCAV